MRIRDGSFFNRGISMRWSMLVLLTVLSTAAARSLHAADPAPALKARPNIIVIMSDDMGYSDLGCYGSEIPTPSLDALAGNGLRFTQFYNNARCCPTRATLLTGLYPHQAGIGHMMNDQGYDGYRGNLNKQCLTIAEVLKPAGYRTYMTGKWHVTTATGADGDKSNWPMARGFEKYYGTIVGAGNFFDPNALVRQNDMLKAADDKAYQPKSYYYTDAISDNSVEFIKQHKAESPDKPFLMYVAYTAAHWPMQAPAEEIAKFKGKYDAGYTPQRAARLAKMKELGLVPKDLDLSPQAEDWNKVEHKAWEARCMEVYAAMISRMDTGIGRIVTQLKDAGQLDNTLILFLQDNGGCAEGIGRVDGKEDKNYRGKTGPSNMPGPADTFIAYGRGWANVSNTPFREYKHWTHEGGISTPLVAHWPHGIGEAQRGKLDRQPAHLIDLMATCVDLGAAKYPKEHAGQPIKPQRGVSLQPAFAGKELGRAEPIFWEHEGNRAVRDGRWKLVAKEHKPWELYDIDADRSESNDLAAKDPERVKTMAAQWDTYAEKSDVLPLGAWNNKKEAKVNDKLDFTLKSGDHLDKADAPQIGKRPFVITATIEADAKTNGVIVAQGGTANGYSLYVKEGVVHFVVRSESKPIDLAADVVLQEKKKLSVSASLNTDGLLDIQLDGKSIAKPRKASTINNTPADGLDVGEDRGAAVGDYKGPFKFTGTIDKVEVQLK
jgi:arylsulfatase A-like enzyme